MLRDRHGKGDAFMKEIIDMLKKLQKGYEEKIPENAPALVAKIFSDRTNLPTLGAGSWEVCLGRLHNRY